MQFDGDVGPGVGNALVSLDEFPRDGLMSYADNVPVRHLRRLFHQECVWTVLARDLYHPSKRARAFIRWRPIRVRFTDHPLLTLFTPQPFDRVPSFDGLGHLGRRIENRWGKVGVCPLALRIQTC